MAYKRDPRNAFIKDAFADGYSTDEINTYLSKKGYEPISKLENIVYNNKFSAGTGIAGGVTGTVLGGKPGTFVGTVGGKALGNIIEDLYEIKKGAYKPAENYREAFNQGMTNVGDAAKWGVGAEVLVNLPSILKALVTPLQTTKNVAANMRTKSIGDKTISNEEAQLKTLENLKANKYFNMATPETQQSAQTRLAQYFRETNPMQTNNPAIGGYTGGQSVVQQSPNISINQMYKTLTPFEQMGRAYTQSGETGGTAIGQGTNLASRAIREYLNAQIPRSAQISNDIYSGISKIQPGAQRIAKYGILSSLPSYLLYQLFKK